MSKKRRRKKMKPYQVKLRVIGVLSLIVSVLVLWLPVPSKAADGHKKTTWQNDFYATSDIVDDTGTPPERYIDLIRYEKDGTTANTGSVIPENEGQLVIPEEARDGYQKAYMPRIGVNGGGEGLFRDKTALKSIDLTNVTTIGATSLANLFSGCTSLTNIKYGTNFDTSAVTDFSNMFSGCMSLTTIDLSKFKTDAAKKISGMFQNCTALTSLDMSQMDFSAITEDQSNVFDGCDNLLTIQSPKNLASGVSIALPWKYKYKDLNDEEKITETLPVVGTAPGNIKPNTSVVLTRVNDVDSMTVDPTGDPEPEIVEIGETIELEIELLPLFVADKTVTVSSSDSTILSIVESTDVNVETDGTATATTDATSGKVKVTVKGEKATEFDATRQLHYSDATITVISNGTDTSGNTKTATCKVRVWEKVVAVTGVSVTPKNGEITIGGAPHDGEGQQQMTAQIEPNTATDRRVTWGVENVDGTTNPYVDVSPDGLVTPKGNGVGDVRVIAKTTDGEYTDYGTITVKSPYSFVKLVDNRTDTSNNNASGVGAIVSNTPISSDWYLHVNTDTTDKAAIDSALAAEGTFRPVSYFKLSKYKTEAGAAADAVSDDFGTATVTMALPGEMLNYPLRRVRLFAYNGTALEDLSSAIVRTTVGSTGTIGAVRFAVPTSDTQLAKTFVLAMDPNTTVTSKGFLYTVSDSSTHAVPDATSTVPTKAYENQKKDWFLVVKSLPTPTTSLSGLVENDATLNAYDEKYYYDIYMTDETGLTKPATPIDFGSVDIMLPLPTGVDWTAGEIRLVSEHNGAIDKNELPVIVKNTENNTDCVRFTATHFSEHAILYDPTASNHTVTTAHTGTGTTAIIPATGITITTTASGDAAASVVPSTNVTVQAEPGTGYHLAGWLKNGILDSGAGTSLVYVFTPTASTTITALFEADSNSGGNASTGGSGTTPVQTYTVTIDTLPSAGGTATADKQTYNSGETATLTAAANDGFAFLYWADAATREPVSSSPAITMTMDGNKHLLAVFAQGEVAGESRTIEANVNVSVPDVNVNVPDVNANVNVSVPDIQVYLNGPGGISAVSGVSSSFIPVRIGNSGDMPKTGIGDMYRIMFAMLLVLSGMVEIMLSIPAKKRRAVHGRNL